MSDQVVRPTTNSVIGPGLLILFTVVWRLAAYRFPSEIVVIPDQRRLALALMGLAFLACGLVVHWVRKDETAGLFLLYCVGGAVHWGGSIGEPSELERTFFMVYLAASVMGEAAFLKLALRFSSRPPSSPGRSSRLLSSPAAAALLLAPLAGQLPQGVLEVVAMLLLAIATLLSLAGGVLFIVGLLKAGSDRVSRRHHASIVAVLVATLLVAESTGDELYDLVYVLVPVVLGTVLLRRREARVLISS